MVLDALPSGARGRAALTGRDRRRTGAAALAALALLFAGLTRPAGACDDVLLALIYGKARVSAFDRDIEAVSTLLGRVASEGRVGKWDAASRAYDRVRKRWLGIYTAHLAEPPDAMKDHPDWKGMLRSFSGRVRDLEALLEARDFDQLHPRVLDLQASLVQTYLTVGTDGTRIALKAYLEPVGALLSAVRSGGTPSASEVEAGLERARSRLRILAALPAARSLASAVDEQLRALDTLEAASAGEPAGGPGPGRTQPPGGTPSTGCASPHRGGEGDLRSLGPALEAWDTVSRDFSNQLLEIVLFRSADRPPVRSP